MIQNFTPIDSLIEQYTTALAGSESTTTSTFQNKEIPKPTNGQIFPDKIALSQISLPKEAAPGGGLKMEITPIQEVVEKQEVEPEVQPFVQVKPQNIKIEPDLKKLGLEPIDKLKYKDFQTLNLPLSDERIAEGLHEPPTSGFRWLAELAAYLLRQVHLKIKVVHGKAVRVLQK